MTELNKKFVGKFWGSLSEKEEDQLLRNSICIDIKTGVEPTKTGPCVVKLNDELSIAGYYQMGGIEDTVEIDDDEKITQFKEKTPN
ncbi:MAG: hypothetical protein RR444_07045 [Oscillospiraceae bacterium]